MARLAQRASCPPARRWATGFRDGGDGGAGEGGSGDGGGGGAHSSGGGESGGGGCAGEACSRRPPRDGRLRTAAGPRPSVHVARCCERTGVSGRAGGQTWRECDGEGDAPIQNSVLVDRSPRQRERSAKKARCGVAVQRSVIAHDRDGGDGKGGEKGAQLPFLTTLRTFRRSECNLFPSFPLLSGVGEVEEFRRAGPLVSEVRVGPAGGAGRAGRSFPLEPTRSAPNNTCQLAPGWRSTNWRASEGCRTCRDRRLERRFEIGSGGAACAAREPGSSLMRAS